MGAEGAARGDDPGLLCRCEAHPTHERVGARQLALTCRLPSLQFLVDGLEEVGPGGLDVEPQLHAEVPHELRER